MKKMKRLFTFLLAAVMIFTMTTTVYAADNGTITINEATSGITYKAYKVFDATTNNTDAAASDKYVAYTYTKKGETDALYTALTGDTSPFVLTGTTKADTFNVSLKTDKTASDVSAFFKNNENNLGTATEVTAAGTSVTISNLGYGYYYISKGTEMPGATVGVTSVAPSQTINDKSTKPGPYTPDPEKPDPDDPNNPGGYKVLADENGKAIKNSNNTANYGDTVYFILQSQATNYDEGKKIVEYTAYDTLGEGFKDFQVTKVTVNGSEIHNHTVDNNASPATITIPWINSESGAHLYTESVSTIKIYCQAVVDEDAVIGEPDKDLISNTTNIGWFNWKYDNKDENDEPEVGPNTPDNPDKETDIVTTKVYAIAIHKTDNKANPLADAEFEIYNGVTKIPVTQVQPSDAAQAAVYKYDKDSTNYIVKSPASGTIIIKGLEGTDYQVKEIKAPAGYNIIKDPVTIESTEFSSSTTTMKMYKDAEGNITDVDTGTETTVTFNIPSNAVNVINLAGTEMPTTGGIGTTIFYVIGGLLAVSAVVLLVTKKRMSM